MLYCIRNGDSENNTKAGKIWNSLQDGLTVAEMNSRRSLHLLNSLLYALLYCLICAEDGLLIDDDFGRIGAWSADA